MRAAIDVGSNTVRLLVADIASGALRPVACRRQVTRLGGGFSAARGLAADAMERTLAALQQFSAVLEPYTPTTTRIAGTEVVRQAANRHVFQALVRERTGHNLEVLSGADEARLAACGVLAGLDARPGAALIFDLGGGSLEFVLVAADRNILWSHSQPLGVVSLAEGAADPAVRHQIIRQHLSAVTSCMKRDGVFSRVCQPETRLVGTAGTVTTLAAMELQMADYRGDAINNTRLCAERLALRHNELVHRSTAEIAGITGLEPGREDLIVPGLEVVLGILKCFQQSSLTVSDYGLLEGLVLEGQG